MPRLIQFVLIFAVVAGFSGCVYYGECGISNRLYDDKEVYYDSQGSYRERCAPRPRFSEMLEKGHRAE